ncbi:MAG TPA: hypothetical protein VF398_07180 [bacterium]|jgi:hypothetical protein
MKRLKEFFGKSWRLIMSLGLLMSLPQISRAQLGQWTRFGLDGGGVAHDVQLLRHDDASPVNDQLWSVSMSSGYYRAYWSGTAWSDWTGHQPGKSGLGVDAIEVSGTEYVLVGTSSTGVQFCDDPTSGNPGWDYPVPIYYPDDWKWARIHDAAFFWPSTGNPTGPEGQYYFLLAAPIYDDQPALVANPGLYRWNSTTFARVDESGWTDTAHGYFRFYRDIESPNILYLDRRQVEGGEYGGLYKISGSYGNPTFAPVDMGLGNTLRDVLGFNQCEYSGDVYTYVLVKRDVSGDPVYSVYVSTTITDEEPEFDLLGDYTSIFPPSSSTNELYDVRSEMAGVMGKPYDITNGYHYLWIVSSGQYGVWRGFVGAF